MALRRKWRLHTEWVFPAKPSQDWSQIPQHVCAPSIRMFAYTHVNPQPSFSPSQRYKRASYIFFIRRCPLFTGKVIRKRKTCSNRTAIPPRFLCITSTFILHSLPATHFPPLSQPPRSHLSSHEFSQIFNACENLFRCEFQRWKIN